jgi:hypothetical protein
MCHQVVLHSAIFVLERQLSGHYPDPKRFFSLLNQAFCLNFSSVPPKSCYSIFPLSFDLLGNKNKNKNECCVLKYGVIINDCLIPVGVGDVVECAASFIT